MSAEVADMADLRSNSASGCKAVISVHARQHERLWSWLTASGSLQITTEESIEVLLNVLRRELAYQDEGKRISYSGALPNTIS